MAPTLCSRLLAAYFRPVLALGDDQRCESGAVNFTDVHTGLSRRACGAANVTASSSSTCNVAPGSEAGPATPASGSAVTMYNPASGATGDVCSPGGLASLSGTNFTSQNPQTARPAALPTSLAGVQVTVNGQAAPLSFASEARMNFQCPQPAPGSPLDVTVESENGVAQQAAPSTMAAASPGIFTVDAANQGVVQIAATNEIAMTSVTGIRSRPAAQGETLTIYATGLGPVTTWLPRLPRQRSPRRDWRTRFESRLETPTSIRHPPGRFPAAPGCTRSALRFPKALPAGRPFLCTSRWTSPAKPRYRVTP